MKVNPGEMNKQIEIVSNSEVEDEYGYESEQTVVVRKCWAKFSRISGTETVKSGADMQDVKARFLVRYSKTKIDRKMQIRYNGDVYEIEYVNSYNDDKEYTEIWGRLLNNG